MEWPDSWPEKMMRRSSETRLSTGQTRNTLGYHDHARPRRSPPSDSH
jgi:hypothetical protein